MERGRSARRVLAWLLFVTGVTALAWPILGPQADGLLSRSIGNGLDDGVQGLRLAVFVATGLLCIWTGRGLLRETATRTQFGRAGATHELPSPSVGFALPALLTVALIATDILLAPPSAPTATATDIALPPDAPTTEPAEPIARSDDVTPSTLPAPVPSTPVAPPADAPPPESPPAKEVAAVPPAVDRPVTETTAPLPDVAAAPPKAASGHSEAVVWLALSPDGTTFMSASTDFSIKLWDARTHTLLRDLGSHGDMARVALYLPDGETVLTAADDGTIVHRRLADAATLHVFSAGQNGGTRRLDISSDGRRAISAHESGAVIVWNLQSGSVEHVMSGHAWPVSGLAMTPDGSRAVSGSIDGELRLWDTDTGKLLRIWKGHERGTYGAKFLADGRRLVTGSGDHLIKLWDIDQNRELARFEGHSGTVYAIDLSADGKTILSGSLDGTARLWDIASGRETDQFIGHSGGVNAVCFGPDGTILTGGGDRTIRIWPPRRGDKVAVISGAR